MNPTPHRVRRIACRVQARTAAEAFAWRRVLRNEVDGVWPTVLGGALDEASEQWHLGDVTLRLPRLELRLAAADPGALAAALAAALHGALAAAVEAPPIAPADPAAPPPLAHTRGAKRLSPSASAREALLGLLDDGRLPWDWVGLDTALLHQQLQAAAIALLDEMRADPAQVAWAQAAPLRVVRWASWLDRAVLDALVVPQTSHSPEWARTIDAFGAAPLGALPHAAVLHAQPLWQWLASLATPAEAPRSLATQATAAPRGRTPQATRAVPLAAMVPGDAVRSAGEARAEAERHPDAMSDAPRWLALDAGLVLLHPFLSRLFEACGLIEANACLIDPVAMPRAAALLHWLASGREGAREHELTLAKLLLGMSPDAALLPASVLDDRLRDEGEALLAATIGHWGVLGSTSIEGLRLSFLQRRGLVAARPDAAGWRVTLESEPFDLLLARLPWALARVHLPWMPWPLDVEWPGP